MDRLHKVRFVRVSDVFSTLTPVAQEMIKRLSHEPVRIKHITGSVDVVRSSTALTPISEMDTGEMRTITPDEWLQMCDGKAPESNKAGWMR
jgi:hypothetical protein